MIIVMPREGGLVNMLHLPSLDHHEWVIWVVVVEEEEVGKE